MKAIRVHAFGDPEVMQVEDVPVPSPGKDEVLVRVKACGVNPVDTYIRSGVYAAKPDLPYTPGSDLGGIVEAVGDGVTRLKAGDRVYSAGTLSGSYAQYALCREDQVHPMPDSVDFSQGAALGVPYRASFRALFHRAKAVAGETVLIHGATGGVGLAAVQWARAAGLTVIGTGGTEEGRKLAREQGAHHLFDHKEPDYPDKILSLTAGRGVDVIIEMLANVNLGKDLTMLAPEGRVVVIGSRGTVEINPRDAMGKESAVLGMLVMNASEKDNKRMHAAIHAGLENKTLRPVVAREMPLDQAVQSHYAVIEKSTLGKIVLIP